MNNIIAKNLVLTIRLLMMLGICSLFFLSMGFCQSTLETSTDVKLELTLIGQKHKTEVPLIYKKHLPYKEDVSWYIRNNTFVAHTTITSTELSQLRPFCHNCLDKSRLVTPIRIELVPIGTVLTVVQVLNRDGRPIRSEEDINLLILEDDQGNLSQISSFGYELEVIDPNIFRSKPWGDELWISYALDFFKDNQFIEAEYCVEELVSSTGIDMPNGTAVFAEIVTDFKLDKEIQLEGFDRHNCPYGVTVLFESEEAFLTIQYHLSEWGLYNKLQVNLLE